MKKYNVFVVLLTMFITLVLGCEPGILQNNPGVNGENPEAFLVTNLFPTNGDIPLVLLMANLPEGVGDGESDLQRTRVYQDYYSSRFTYNAQEYLLQVSGGIFTFEFQGVWGPYNIPEEETGSIAEVTAEALRQAVSNRFNLQQFDKNRNGVIEQDELMIMVVDNGSAYGGAVRWISTSVDGVDVRMLSGIHGSHANLATIVHEITHLLGTRDLYGSNCNSFDLTLMSCTILNRPGDDTVHLDPWHKMHLGWVEPRFISIPDLENKTCYTLEAPQFAEMGYNDNQMPLLVYDPYLGGNDYFMIEFRNGNWFVDNMLSYERTVPGAGVAIWSVRVDANGLPLEVPSIVKQDGWDASIWTYGSRRDTEWEYTLYRGLDLDYNIIIPEQSPSAYNRSSYLWGPGYVMPRYQDGTFTGFVMEIREFSGNANRVEVCLQP